MPIGLITRAQVLASRRGGLELVADVGLAYARLFAGEHGGRHVSVQGQLVPADEDLLVWFGFDGVGHRLPQLSEVHRAIQQEIAAVLAHVDGNERRSVAERLAFGGSGQAHLKIALFLAERRGDEEKQDQTNRTSTKLMTWMVRFGELSATRRILTVPDCAVGTIRSKERVLDCSKLRWLMKSRPIWSMSSISASTRFEK